MYPSRRSFSSRRSFTKKPTTKKPRIKSGYIEKAQKDFKKHFPQVIRLDKQVKELENLIRFGALNPDQKRMAQAKLEKLLIKKEDILNKPKEPTKREKIGKMRDKIVAKKRKHFVSGEFGPILPPPPRAKGIPFKTFTPKFKVRSWF